MIKSASLLLILTIDLVFGFGYCGSGNFSLSMLGNRAFEFHCIQSEAPLMHILRVKTVLMDGTGSISLLTKLQNENTSQIESRNAWKSTYKEDEYWSVLGPCRKQSLQTEWILFATEVILDEAEGSSFSKEDPGTFVQLEQSFENVGLELGIKKEAVSLGCQGCSQYYSVNIPEVYQRSSTLKITIQSDGSTLGSIRIAGGRHCPGDDSPHVKRRMIDSEMFQEKLEGVMEGTLHIALEIQKPNTEYSIQLDVVNYEDAIGCDEDSGWCYQEEYATIARSFLFFVVGLLGISYFVLRKIYSIVSSSMKECCDDPERTLI